MSMQYKNIMKHSIYSILLILVLFMAPSAASASSTINTLVLNDSMKNANKRALIVVTNHWDFENEKADSTGLWFSELTHFYEVFQEAGIPMDIVSIKGGKIPIDQRSLSNFMLDKKSTEYYQDSTFMALLENTQKISDIDKNSYDIIYLAGGHGAMWDLAESTQLQTLIADMYEEGKVVAAVCHGVAGLQNVKLSNGEYLLNGKKGTGFSYFDEGVTGDKEFVPYNMQERLSDRGMDYSKAFFPLSKHVVVDGNLITGQNPNSAHKAAEKALEVLISLSIGSTAEN